MANLTCTQNSSMSVRWKAYPTRCDVRCCFLRGHNSQAMQRSSAQSRCYWFKSSITFAFQPSVGGQPADPGQLTSVTTGSKSERYSGAWRCTALHAVPRTLDPETLRMPEQRAPERSDVSLPKHVLGQAGGSLWKPGWDENYNSPGVMRQRRE